jgi:hypothetical protein
MGNLKNIETENSILSTAEIKKYTDNISSYPLPLDAAFPLFNWKVLFRNNAYSGLIENLPNEVLDKNIAVKKNDRFEIMEDTIVNGYAFKKGDVLRDEQSNYAEIISAAGAIKKLLKNTRTRVSFYHLDSILLKKYSTHELETVFNSLR